MRCLCMAMQEHDSKKYKYPKVIYYNILVMLCTTTYNMSVLFSLTPRPHQVNNGSEAMSPHCGFYLDQIS